MMFPPCRIPKNIPHLIMAPSPFVGAFDFVLPAPTPGFDAVMTTMQALDMDAYHTAYNGKLLVFPSDDQSWTAAEEMDHVLWLKNMQFDTLTATTTYAAHPPPSSASAPGNNHGRNPLLATAASAAPRRFRSPQELAKRGAHRRSLQQGYEKAYRQRKRQSREQLREEWLVLENELKQALRTAQNNTVVSRCQGATIDTSSSSVEQQLTELRDEERALDTEQFVLQCMLDSEERLKDAREYFTQPLLREKVNALTSSPSMFLQFEFEW